MSATNSANDPQPSGSTHTSSSAGGQTATVATNGTHAPAEKCDASRAPEGADALKLKNENERLLSELKNMKQQMQVVQGREQGITKAYLGVCRDLDKVSFPIECLELSKFLSAYHTNVHLRRR